MEWKQQYKQQSEEQQRGIKIIFESEEERKKTKRKKDEKRIEKYAKDSEFGRNEQFKSDDDSHNNNDQFERYISRQLDIRNDSICNENRCDKYKDNDKDKDSNRNKGKKEEKEKKCDSEAVNCRRKTKSKSRSNGRGVNPSISLTASTAGFGFSLGNDRNAMPFESKNNNNSSKSKKRSKKKTSKSKSMSALSPSCSIYRSPTRNSASRNFNFFAKERKLNVRNYHNRNYRLSSKQIYSNNKNQSQSQSEIEIDDSSHCIWDDLNQENVNNSRKSRILSIFDDNENNNVMNIDETKSEEIERNNSVDCCDDNYSFNNNEMEVMFDDEDQYRTLAKHINIVNSHF